MEKVLKSISKSAILLNAAGYTAEQKKSKWIGFAPATDAAIEATEKRLNCALPEDYKAFLRITNGFAQTNTSVHSSFLPIEKIDFLIHLDIDLVEIWEDTGNIETGKILRTSILIGGLNESQQILLIPQKNKWIYWQFAAWIPGEQPYKNLIAYFKSVHQLLKADTSKPQPEPIRDFSLRDSVFAFDWQAVYDKSKALLINDTYFQHYQYYNGNADLYALMLLASNRLKCQSEFIAFLKSLPAFSPNAEAIKLGQVTENQQVASKLFIERYIATAQEKHAFESEIQELKRYKPQENPKTLDDIEAQIKKHRKDLLKEQNIVSKISYQFFFLYEYGNTEALFDFYDKHKNGPRFFSEPLKLAIYFAHVGNHDLAKLHIQQYMQDSIESRPFEPYLIESLLPILENK